VTTRDLIVPGLRLNRRGVSRVDKIRPIRRPVVAASAAFSRRLPSDENRLDMT
jgi:hypothetical protein